MKKALIFGVNGQDGILLTEYLHTQNYEIYGTDITEPKHKIDVRFEKLDAKNSNKIKEIIKAIKPNEIYNFAGKSFIPDSWAMPSETIEVNALSVATILEAIRDFSKDSHFFQASSSDIFGKTPDVPQNESSKMIPQTPYAATKLMAHNLVRCFRENYNLFACSGILYNHESEYRGEQFVTKKIVKAAVEFKTNKRKEKLLLGDITSQKDWGYARDFVKAMHMILNADKADDYVIGTGILNSVEDILNISFSELGLNWNDYVGFSDEFKRTYTTQTYRADPSKLINDLKWKPTLSFAEMIKHMVNCEYEKSKICN